jgi:hypothetical protein
VDVAAGAVQVQQIVDSVMAMAELRLATVMVADIKGWATAATLTSELHTPYLMAKYSAQVKNTCKHVRTKCNPLFWDGWSQDKWSQCSTLLSLDCDQSLKCTTSQGKTVNCYVCGVDGHYTNWCPDSKSKKGWSKLKSLEK